MVGAAAGALTLPEYRPLAKCVTGDSKVAIATIVSDIGLVAFRELVKNGPGLLKWMQSVVIKK